MPANLFKTFRSGCLRSILSRKSFYLIQKRDEVKDVYEANTTIQSGEFPSRPSTTGKSHIITVTILRFMYLHVIQK